ncbi:MAG: SHOCT domain-containing protein [Dehalococcoidia bacterium]
MPNAGDERSWILFPLVFPILFPILFPMLTMMFWMMASRSGPFGMMSSRGGSSRGEEPRPRDAGGGAESPLETAQRRYAAGEISREEFQRIRDDLSP